jgi:exopolyphosphatase / guanosine-5'-triphosphate,3'-diphosphate pyrophosphatase
MTVHSSPLPTTSPALLPPAVDRGGPEMLAALDLGTNNCRLLVARVCPGGFEIVDSFSRIVRLGEGVAASGRLAEGAMARTVAALRVCARIMARHGVRRARCVATEACRRAVNGAAFLARVRRATGLRFEILPREEEANLALLGCLPLIDPAARQVLVVDIGGGSTEVVWLDRAGAAPAYQIALSLPCGVVSLSESFGRDAADDATFEAMVGHVSAALRRTEATCRIAPRLAAEAGLQMLGTSGTVTTLAALHLGLPRYDRRRVDGIELDFSAIDAVSRALRGMDNAARAAHPCIGQGRADLVVAGCAILEAVHRCWPAARLRVADRGVREGILHALMGRSLGPGRTEAD